MQEVINAFNEAWKSSPHTRHLRSPIVEVDAPHGVAVVKCSYRVHAAIVDGGAELADVFAWQRSHVHDGKVAMLYTADEDFNDAADELAKLVDEYQPA